MRRLADFVDFKMLSGFVSGHGVFPHPGMAVNRHRGPMPAGKAVGRHQVTTVAAVMARFIRSTCPFVPG